MIFAKLINGEIRFCPLNGNDEQGRMHTNLPKYYEKHLDIAANNGYYPVVYTDKPQGNYIASWEMQTVDDVQSIAQVWTQYTPEPEPIPVDVEKLRADVDYISMMEDIDLDGGIL